MITPYERTWIIDGLTEDIQAGYISEEEARRRLAYAERTGKFLFERDARGDTPVGAKVEPLTTGCYSTKEYKEFKVK